MLCIANLGCIEFHPLHGKGPDQTHPNYMFFDLDPFEPAGWNEVRYVAGLVKVMLDQFGFVELPEDVGRHGDADHDPARTGRPPTTRSGASSAPSPT